MSKRVRLQRGAFLLGLACCVAPVFWAPVGSLLYTADYNLPLDSRRTMAALVSGWSTDNLGTATQRFTPHLFPFLAFWRAGQALGVPLWLVQKLWLVGLFVLAYLSARALVRFLVPCAPQWTSTVVALTYVFNPFTLYSFAVGHNIGFLAYAAAPLWLVTLLRAVRPGSGWTQRITAAATSLLFASSFDNPAIIATLVVVPTALMLVTEAMARRSDLRAIGCNTVAVGALAVGFHSWWLIPSIWNAVSGSPYRYAGSAGRLFDWPALATPVHFTEFLRGEGYWGQYASYQGVPYLPWAASFTRPVLVACSWLLASLAMCGLLVHRRPPSWVKVGALLFVVSVVLSKGINPPASAVNRWLYLHVPGFYVFRGTYEKFGGMAFLGVLLGATAVLLLPRWSSGVRRGLTGLLAVLTAASAWPLVSGDVAPPVNANGVASTVRVPADYGMLRDWTTSTASFGSLLVAPQSPSGYVKTDWGFAGADPLPNFSALPVITGEPEARSGDGPRFRVLLELMERPEDAALAQRLGVAYVVVRHDVDPDFYDGTTPPDVVERRLRQAGYAPERSFGKLSVWRPPVHTALLWFRPARRGPEARATPPLLIGGEVGEPRPLSNAAFSGSATLEATAQISGPVWLYLAQDFSSGWHLSVEGEQGRSARVLRHAQPADFGNAWLVEGGEGVVSFRISYGNPAERQGAWVFTGVALSAALFLVARDRARKRRVRRRSGSLTRSAG